MISFEDVQQDARDRVAAAALFAAESVLLDLGDKDNDRESALNGRGFCITVPPIISANLVGDKPFSKTVVDAVIAVLVEVNVKKNSAGGGAGIDIYAAIKAVITALITQHTPTNPNDNYLVAPNAVDYSDFDPGLLGYIVTFTKRCVI